MPTFKGTMKVHQLKNDFSVIESPKIDFYYLSTLEHNDREHHLGSLIYKREKKLQVLYVITT